MSIGEFWAGRMTGRELLALVLRLPREDGAFKAAMENAKKQQAAAADDAKAQALAERQRARRREGST